MWATLTTMLLVSFDSHAAADYTSRNLADFSLEQLADLRINSVSRRPERLNDAPASVFVITAEAIRRSGATTLPEALRLAPNLQVARVDARTWAISARGFNATTANKLQVLIDGRIAYTPLFSGVFWDVQAPMLEDVERIEVISGPAATTWGSNAVNGVINVITRRAGDTQGGLLTAAAGEQQRGASLRYGAALADGGHYRVYGQTQGWGQTTAESGSGNGDAWHRGQAGFRIDTQADGDLTLQGAAYEGRRDQAGADSGTLRGLNLLARWQHPLAGNAQVQLQGYYDRTERDLPGTFAETLDILDLELQHRLYPSDRQQLVWGLGHRSAWDSVDNSALLAFLPADRHLGWTNLFLNDEIRLAADLRLTLGARLEHNSYTGLEWMPSARLAWNLDPDTLLWAALSRAVRTPSRLDREFFVPSLKLNGGPGFDAETLNALEFGIRAQPSERASYALTLFHHDYDDLRTLEPAGGGTFVIDNGLKAESYGLEAWGEYRVTERWRLGAGTLLQHQAFELKPGSADANGGTGEANDPANQWQLRSSLDLGRDYQLDLGLRHVGRLSHPAVPAYEALDLRLGWRPQPALELALTASDLLGPDHAEFGSTTSRARFERRLLLTLRYRF